MPRRNNSWRQGRCPSCPGGGGVEGGGPVLQYDHMCQGAKGESPCRILLALEPSQVQLLGVEPQGGLPALSQPAQHGLSLALIFDIADLACLQ